MSGVFLIGKEIGGQSSTKMITSARGDMHGAEDFFVLNIASRNGEFLGAETEFAEFTGDGIGGEFGVMFGDGERISAEEGGLADATIGNGHDGNRAVLIFVRKGAIGGRGDVVDFARGKVGDIWATATEAVAFLGFLATEIEVEGVVCFGEEEINFDPVGVGHSESKFFGPFADLEIIDGQS